jgi:hypothetical protein
MLTEPLVAGMEIAVEVNRRQCTISFTVKGEEKAKYGTASPILNDKNCEFVHIVPD